MAKVGTPDRAELESKDREQLQEIAGALGVKAPTRTRKAELVDAIIEAASTNGGDKAETEPKKKVRSTRRSDDDLAALAEEENSLDADNTGDDTPPARRRKPASESKGSGSKDSSNGGSRPDNREGGDRGDRNRDRNRNDRGDKSRDDKNSGDKSRGDKSRGGKNSGDKNRGGRSKTASGVTIDEEDERAARGDGNRKRRRRGRNRGNRQQEDREPQGDPIDCEGLLDMRDEGYAFLRTKGFLPSKNDVYVSASQVRRFGLRKGDYIKGVTRPAGSSEKYPALLKVHLVNDMTPDDAKGRPRFEDLTPLFPDENLRLEQAEDPQNVTGRIIDLISPVGKGQRGLIVSPPKAGKTTILKQIVYSIERNNPECHLMVLLVDERPEEVTDMKRHVLKGEVIASTFDRPSDEHTQVAELTIDRAKRLVEMGTDVVIVLDGITRLARAYNLASPASGRVLSGGVDSTALYPPKRFFGAARNIEEGGSLTIVATALIETGSRMDEVIFEEFKGTGNMELRLDRRLAERRIYPAIDVEQSSTRHEELLFERKELQQVWKLRRVLNALDGGGGLELLVDKIKSTESNKQFLTEIAQAPTA